MNKLIPAFLLIACSLNAQQKETVDLRWKIKDTLTYDTVMHDVLLETSEKKTGTASTSNRMSGMLKEMQEQSSSLKYETKLFPDNKGKIDIEMIAREDKKDTTKTFVSSLVNMMDGNAVLRGKISPQGDLLSFYYKRAQNNIISILFELPTKVVAVGEEWSLNVNMAEMDPNFKADSIYKKNIVRLKDIKNENGDNIAIIEYDLHEFVSGDFSNKMMKMFSEAITDEKIVMQVSHKAIGEFNLEKGHWNSYEGSMDTETNISVMGMSANKRTVFKLTPKE